MIPIYLSISGFLSYRDPQAVDFTRLSLACISGANGAGKSSLLDAITWALFGEARKRDDSVINSQSHTAEVGLTFAYEGNVYRVQRSKMRDKSTVLEFQILQAGNPVPGAGDPPRWKVLTERTLRETEACIKSVLRLDYETFVNASFFLQGKADQFTQQKSSDRKRILSSILGLEVWEVYRQRAADRRKGVENEISSLDGRLSEIAKELDEEDVRKARLSQVEAERTRLAQARAAQETALESFRQVAAVIDAQRKAVETLARQQDAGLRRLIELKEKASERKREKEAHAALIVRAAEIEAALAAWHTARKELEQWDEIASRSREHEKLRQPLLDEINHTRARLEEQANGLKEAGKDIERMRSEMTALEAQLTSARSALEHAEAMLSQRAGLEAELDEARHSQADARAENPRLKAEMDELKERIDRLKEVEGAGCPLCGQPLSLEDRQKLIASLEAHGKEMGDRFRANKALQTESEKQVSELQSAIAALAQVEANQRSQVRQVDQLTDRLDQYRKMIQDWEANDQLRLDELQHSLAEGSFAPEARLRLAEVDAGLREIGYDPAAHEAVRKAEAAGRGAQDEVLALEKARAALAPLEREYADLQKQIEIQQAEADHQQLEVERAAAALAEAERQAPDIEAAERELWNLQEQENRMHMEVGAARQKVMVLEDLKIRRKALQTQREEQGRLVGQLRQLEKAFGKDGVPALLIEQALPQIEGRANELLERLSGGTMSVRFVTQAAYKDKRREDLKETLDIQISDGSGTRDYEMFSGGEGFRVNFAIRLALSEVLAQRAGARLQILVIDEGFGSQDALGRQRLIEAINLVREDFALVLVISHIDELKDAFPSRIQVEKTPRGSMVSVL